MKRHPFDVFAFCAGAFFVALAIGFLLDGIDASDLDTGWIWPLARRARPRRCPVDGGPPAVRRGGRRIRHRHGCRCVRPELDEVIAPASTPGAIVFVDVVGFTAFTERFGDDHALTIVDRIEHVTRSALPYGARLVKLSGRRRARLVRPRAASGADDARDRPRPRRRRSFDPGPRRRPLRPRRLARRGRRRSRCQRRSAASSTWPVPARSCAPRRHVPRPIPRPCGSRPVVSRCSKASIVAFTCTPWARSVAPSEHAPSR